MSPHRTRADVGGGAHEGALVPAGCQTDTGPIRYQPNRAVPCCRVSWSCLNLANLDDILLMARHNAEIPALLQCVEVPSKRAGPGDEINCISRRPQRYQPRKDKGWGWSGVIGRVLFSEVGFLLGNLYRWLVRMMPTQTGGIQTDTQR